MISAEAPILFAKACELFIMDITFRALLHTNLSKRKTLQRSDIAATIGNNEMFDFLIDIIPREETDKEHLNKRDNDKANLAQFYKFMPKNIYPFPESTTFMKHPLYGQPGNQSGIKLPAPRPMLVNDSFIDPLELDNQDNKSLTNWSIVGHANRNKSFQQNHN
jgi:hypothetical protein